MSVGRTSRGPSYEIEALLRSQQIPLGHGLKPVAIVLALVIGGYYLIFGFTLAVADGLDRAFLAAEVRTTSVLLATTIGGFVLLGVGTLLALRFVRYVVYAVVGEPREALETLELQSEVFTAVRAPMRVLTGFGVLAVVAVLIVTSSIDPGAVERVATSALGVLFATVFAASYLHHFRAARHASCGVRCALSRLFGFLPALASALSLGVALVSCWVGVPLVLSVLARVGEASLEREVQRLHRVIQSLEGEARARALADLSKMQRAKRSALALELEDERTVGTVVAAGSSLHREPSSTSLELGTVLGGAQVEALETAGAWVRVAIADPLAWKENADLSRSAVDEILAARGAWVAAADLQLDARAPARLTAMARRVGVKLSLLVAACAILVPAIVRATQIRKLAVVGGTLLAALGTELITRVLHAAIPNLPWKGDLVFLLVTCGSMCLALVSTRSRTPAVRSGW